MRTYLRGERDKPVHHISPEYSAQMLSRIDKSTAFTSLVIAPMEM